MTEDEAKTKWCPFARVLTRRDGIASVTSVNRQADGARSQGTTCIGSACMAWRDLFEPSEEDVARVVKVGEPIGAFRYRKAGGFCGLAGKPT